MSNQSCNPTRRKCIIAFRRGLQGAAWSAILAGSLVLAGCGNTVIRQGHLFHEEDVAQIKNGMGKDQVVLALGTPDTQSTTGGGSYYYISQTANQPMPFMKAEVTDRRIVAIYFDKKDKVEQIANYGMKDGKVFDFVRRETPAYSRDQGLLKELFRDIGMGPDMGKMLGGDKQGPGN
jgi:outer membrane protein assembly factor BamE (lipoprotein component of BamABCDE complex)